MEGRAYALHAVAALYGTRVAVLRSGKSNESDGGGNSEAGEHDDCSDLGWRREAEAECGCEGRLLGCWAVDAVPVLLCVVRWSVYVGRVCAGLKTCEG